MTPLEEIEHDIAYLNKIEPNQDKRIRALGPLYQARAIERLEATVRAIGVLIQHEADEKRDRGPARFDPAAYPRGTTVSHEATPPHAYMSPAEYLAGMAIPKGSSINACAICGEQAGAEIHHPREQET